MALSMDRWVGKVAVVTGASVGIGAAITATLVKEGVVVAGIARRKDLLEKLAKDLSKQKGKLVPVKADLSNEKEIVDSFKWIKEKLGPIHILINNAGFTIPDATLPDGNAESWTKIFQINVVGLCIATREAIKDMKANNVDGHIIHINSVLGHIYRAGTGIYSPSKHTVTALAETLRLELMAQKSKIKVTSLSPGLVNTEFLVDFKKKTNFQKILDEKRILDPEDVANAVAYVLSTPPHVQIQELTIRPVTDWNS